MELTWKQVWTRADVLPSTATSQRNRYPDYFPCTGKGRQRRYGEESVGALIIISSMSNEGKGYDEILEALQDRFGMIANITATNNDDKTATNQQDVITAIKEAFREEIKALEDKIDLLATDARERDTQSQSRDTLLMENIRLLQKKKRKWWQWS